MTLQNFALRVNEDGFVLMPGLDQNLDRTGGAGHPNPNAESSEQRHPLGTVLWDPSGGRMWKYAKNGAVALVMAGLVQSKVPIAGHEDMPVQTEVSGATSIRITPATTPIVVKTYDEGFLWVNDDTG